MNSKISELLNARHADLQFELGVYLQLDQLKNLSDKSQEALEELQNGLVDKFGVELEEIAEDEEIEVDEVSKGHIQDALKYALDESATEMRVYLQMDRTIKQLTNTGALEEEVKGLHDFKNRLEQTVFDRYDITEDDLKEEGDE